MRRDESCRKFKCRGLNFTLNCEGLNSEDIILMVLRCGDLMCDGSKFYVEVIKGEYHGVEVQSVSVCRVPEGLEFEVGKCNVKDKHLKCKALTMGGHKNNGTGAEENGTGK